MQNISQKGIKALYTSPQMVPNFSTPLASEETTLGKQYKWSL